MSKKATKEMTSGEDFDAFVKKHCPLGASALMIYEVSELDQNGRRRWMLTYCGSEGNLELMTAHAMAQMSAAHERRRAEMIRNSGR